MIKYKKTLKNSLSTTFNDLVWMKPDVVKATNCYTYATGLPAAGWARPGELKNPEGGNPYKVPLRYKNLKFITAENINAQILNDGYVRIPREEALDPNAPLSVFACYIKPRYDYHFIRKNEKSLWAHKLCDDPVKILRHYNDAPWVPEKKLNKIYTNLVGFYREPECGIDYIQHLDL